MSAPESETQSTDVQAGLIGDLESLLAMCQVRRPAKGEKVFACWIIAAFIVAILGCVAIAMVKTCGSILLMAAMMAFAVGMCNYPVDQTMTKEECAQVFSRFNHLPDNEALLERYASSGTLSYYEVASLLKKALYKLRMAERKSEIMELAKGVKDIPSKAV